MFEVDLKKKKKKVCIFTWWFQTTGLSRNSSRRKTHLNICFSLLTLLYIKWTLTSHKKLKVILKNTKLFKVLILKLWTALGHPHFLFLFERLWICWWSPFPSFSNYHINFFVCENECWVLKDMSCLTETGLFYTQMQQLDFFFFPTGGTVIGQASQHPPRIMVRSRKLCLRFPDWLLELSMTCCSPVAVYDLWLLAWEPRLETVLWNNCTENLSLPSASVTAHPEMRGVDVSQRDLQLYSGNERSGYWSSFVANVQNHVKIHNVHHSSSPPPFLPATPDRCRRAWLISGNVSLDAQWQSGIWSMSVQAEGARPNVPSAPAKKLRAEAVVSLCGCACVCVSAFFSVGFSRKWQSLCRNARVSFQITFSLQSNENLFKTLKSSAWLKHLRPCRCELLRWAPAIVQVQRCVTTSSKALA